MRIVILSNDYPPNVRGGAGVIAYEHSEGLKRRSHDVFVIHHPARFIEVSPFLRFFYHLADLFPKDDLVKQMSALQPDVLLTHTLMGCGFGTPRKIQSQGVPWIHVLHDVQLVEPSGQIVHGESMPKLRLCWRWCWSVLRRRTFGTPNVVLSPSRWLLSLHQQFGFFTHASTHILPNPLPQFDSRSMDGDSSILKQDFLYVGRLDADKGVEILIEAWERLGSDRPRLHLVGDGDLYSHIEQKGDSKIVLRGRMDHNRVQSLYQTKPTVIVPSLVYENQPTVILEALSFACPVIASRVGGIPELLPDHVLFEPGDVRALHALLQKATEWSEQEISNTDSLSRHHSDAVLDELELLLKSNL
ncbi:MAG: glycosyltransferase [bacterium]|nr:glycosyltransferase [bacterium]